MMPLCRFGGGARVGGDQQSFGRFLALQGRLGRQSCAEPSVWQETLDACTAGKVEQMHRAMDENLSTPESRCPHDYHRSLQVLDVDMTVCPVAKAACATKGYCAHQRHRRGRRCRGVGHSSGEMVWIALWGHDATE